ncbi:hypothetical protein GUJ93_ZPchr0006g44381 [Zizania palustris]|uniref:Homeobox domain-containing protein n=1 Tax=Zizania palustris TaxID=103762 RepID=A0A8J5SUE3_ZIZPA|nr:hypothetical protein GUJ93_ZPchr0006g44381 [Zizania palustris]
MARQSLDLGLSLGLGVTTAAPRPAATGFYCLNSGIAAAEQEVSPAVVAAEEERMAARCPGSPVSTLSSGSGKRADRSAGSGDDDDAGCDGGSARKKLRLSKDQAAVLEECFKTHHTLTPKQKLALASSLSLRPRQVEVWFQNRRARTKLKQTEVDCEYLKRWCDQLVDENRRLEKEVAELRALKASTPPTPSCAAAPLTTLTMCHSCKRVASSLSSSTTHAVAAGANAGMVSQVALLPGHPQFFCGFRDSTTGAAYVRRHIWTRQADQDCQIECGRHDRHGKQAIFS